MPRRRHGLNEAPRIRFPDLVAELSAELKNSRESGQPMIDEQHFPRTKAVRVTVIWDKWEPLSDEDRYETILQAYEQAEGKDFRDRIALAIGLTVPEAVDLGMLSFQVTTALRKGDPVTLAQCRDAMIAEGASVLLDPNKPQLRFATAEEAEACVRRLSKQLPGSEPVWVITREAARVAN
jgi:hypothetical protein